MLEIHRSQIGTITVLDIIGRIDAINCSELHDAIENELEEGHERNLLLKMTEVNYLSAAGLRVLRTLHQKTGIVRIAEPSIRVIEVMQITGLDAVYQFYKTLAEALRQDGE